MSGPYYNTSLGQPQIPSGTSPVQATSPSADASRKSKRQYPQMPSQVSPMTQPPVYQQPVQQQPMQQQPVYQHVQQQPMYQQPVQQQPMYQQSMYQQPAYNSPVPHENYGTGYNQALAGMANMSMFNGNPAPREDVSLVGQPPLVQDLHRQPPAINLPPNVSATNSPFVQVDHSFKRSTVNAFPQTKALHKKSKLPLALVLQPYLSSKTNKVTVPVVPDTTVARCSRCKTYINPFVKFAAGALQWVCNMCGMNNDVPQAFDWDVSSQQHADRYSRPELNYGCVDFIAPADYIVRPPQPPAYVFVIDISFQAVQTGMVSVVADAIKESLDKIPNEDGRAQVAFITADNAIGFYKLVGQPEILVVGELNDIYLPRMASDLIVNLVEARNMIDTLLNKMKLMHNQSQQATNCLGSALQAARKLLSPTGGKIICFQASLPNGGEGLITPKQENKSVLDTPLTTVSSSFYRTFAGECTKSQVCADMFIFGNQFSDVATLNVVPRFTGGQTHFYPGFHASNQAESARLKEEIISLLSEEIGLEAVMRTRCSEGIICKAFYGNFTTRVPDVMALPNVPRDQSYCVELDIEEDIQSSCVFFQTALLYTTCCGERRIRVMNLCLPVTKSMSELYSSADQTMITRALCHQAIDKGANGKLRDARDYLTKQTTEICTVYGKEVLGIQTPQSQLTLCRELSLFPLLVLGLLKSEAFNDLGTIHPDIRAQSAILLRTLPTDPWLSLIHPNFYSIHNMPQSAGTIDEKNGTCIFPPNANLCSEKLESHGCYMIENSQNIFLWIGKQAVPQLCKDLLGVPSIHEVKSGQMAILPRIKSPISERLSTMIRSLRSERQVTYYPSIYIVKEDGDPALRAKCLSYLLEDRQPTGPTAAGSNQSTASSGMSYYQWLGFIRSKCQ